MKALITSFSSGVLFAIGLGISGMTRPVKVIGFLDFSGNWDPSLALVMIGAIGVYFIADRMRRGMPSPSFGAKFAIPSGTDLDLRLIGGAALFGVGWGLGGFCPGPAIVSLASGATPVAIFVASMISGMYLHSRISRDRQPELRPAGALLTGADA